MAVSLGLLLLLLATAPRVDAGQGAAPLDAGVTTPDAGAALDAGLTPEQLERAGLVASAKERQADVFQCYAAALRDAPGLAGMIRVAWTVEVDGRTSDVHVDETDLDSPALHECVTASIRAWRFPKRSNGAPVKIAYKWTLHPKARR